MYTLNIRKAFVVFGLLIVPALASADHFLDTQGHPNSGAIHTLSDLGIVEGYGNGIFRPDISINRAEFLKILMLAVFGDEVFAIADTRCFEDFTGGEEWYWRYACIAKARGIIHGYPDGTFRGGQTVNLAEAMKIAVNAWEIPVVDGNYAEEYWYVPFFEVGASRGLFRYGKLPERGDYLLTRSDMAYVIVGMDEQIQDVSAITGTGSDQGTGADAGSDDGSVTVTECGNGVLDPGEACDDGNLIDGDGCSHICASVPLPVHHGAMRIEQRAIAGASVAPGTDDVPVFAFDAIAGRQDVLLTSVALRAALGDLADANNYRILYDSNNDGVVDQEAQSAAAQSDLLSFGGMEIPVPDGLRVRVELRADILESVTSGTFALEFDTSDPLFIQGVGQADGRDLTGIELNGADCTADSICWIAVFTDPVAAIQIAGHGSLFVAPDATPVASHQLLGSQISTDILRFALRAVDEEIEVTEFRFSGFNDDIDHVLVYKAGSNAPFATARETDCTSPASGVHCASTSLFLDADEEESYTIRAMVKSDEDGGQSGGTVDPEMAVSAGSILTVEARGVSSQTDLVINDGNSVAEGEVIIGRNDAGPDAPITGPTHDIVLAKIERISNTNTDSDGTAVPTGIHPFGVFTFGAAEHTNTDGGLNDVTIRTLVFDVNASNVEFQGGTFSIVNTANPSISVACVESGITGNITVTCTDLHTSGISTVIESGSDVELALRGNVINPNVLSQGSSTLQASLLGLSDRSNPGTVEWDDGEETFGWVDLGETQVRSTGYSS